MKNILTYFLCLTTIAFCCTNKSKSIKIVEKENTPKFSSDSLLGTWVNQNLLLDKYSGKSIVQYFRPISGFTVTKNLRTSKVQIIIQYGEQSAEYNCDSLLLFSDSLYGINAGIKTFISLYNLRGHILHNLLLIDTSVYVDSTYAFPLMINFCKISNCQPKCSFEQFALNEILKPFPMKVIYNSRVFNLSYRRRTECSCNGFIDGIAGYSNYQLLDSYLDKNGYKTIEIALYNEKKAQHEFFNIIIKDKNYLVPLSL